MYILYNLFLSSLLNSLSFSNNSTLSQISTHANTSSASSSAKNLVLIKGWSNLGWFDILYVFLGIPILIILGLDLVKKNKEKKQSDSKQAELEAEIARLKAQKSEAEESNNQNIEE